MKNRQNLVTLSLSLPATAAHKDNFNTPRLKLRGIKRKSSPTMRELNTVSNLMNASILSFFNVFVLFIIITYVPFARQGCKSNAWHPDHTNSNGCSNSLDYPPEWAGVPGMFSPTSQACCDFFKAGQAGQECRIYQVCEEEPATTTSSTTKATTYQAEDCESNQWHPDIVNRDGCTNSLYFPEEWIGNPNFFTATPEECCNFFFSDNVEACIIREDCTVGPPSSSTVGAPETTTTSTAQATDCNKWFPDIINKDGCTNSVHQIPVE
jgi:hypothetical protein